MQVLVGGGNPLILIGALMVLLIAIGAVVVALIVRSRSRARFKRRLQSFTQAAVAAASTKKGQQKNLLIQGKLNEIEGAGKRRSERLTLRNRIEMAGLSVTTKQFNIASAVAGLLAFLVPLIMGISFFADVLFGIAVGVGAPRAVLAYLTSKRRNKFISGFADAVDIIVRGIQSGLPLGECVTIISREAPEPIGGEFRTIVESTRLGLNLQQGLERSIVRMPVPEFKFFAIVLTIQQETGGNLAETLSNLSGILRDRKAMKDKVKAMSAEARTTAMIIGCLPFLMGGILYLSSPEYLKLLFSTSSGNLMIVGGIVMMALGSMIMAKMINFKL